jgi:hypothetical protein
MKKRLIAASLTLLIFLALSLAIAANLGFLISGKIDQCTLHPDGVLLLYLADPRNVKLFHILAFISFILVSYFTFGNSYLNYRSKMYEVVPGFSIPLPHGQGQHGTAWFLSPKKFNTTFAFTIVEGPLQLDEDLKKRYQEERRIIHGEKSEYAETS